MQCGVASVMGILYRGGPREVAVVFAICVGMSRVCVGKLWYTHLGAWSLNWWVIR